MLQILFNGFISGLVIALIDLAFKVASLPTRVFHIALAGMDTVEPFIVWSLWRAA